MVVSPIESFYWKEIEAKNNKGKEDQERNENGNDVAKIKTVIRERELNELLDSEL